MAEVTGLIIGAISLASLFDSVVSNFDRIQVGRELDETHQRYLLQLEVLKLRLHRWRNAVSKLLEMDDSAVKQADGKLVERHLNDIQKLFEKEEVLSKSYEASTNEAEGWLAKSLQNLSRKHRAETSSIRSKFRWAIHGKKEFEELVGNASVQVSNLEHIIATKNMKDHLNEMRIHDAFEIGRQREANVKDINLLQEIALIVDHEFADVVKMKAVNEWNRNIAEDSATLHQGDMVSSDYRGTAIVPGGLWNSNIARGKSRVTQGTAYGFNPFAQ